MEPGATTRSVEPSAISPLRHSLFRALWIASVFSNTGTWMQNVGAAWLMTSLAPSAVMISLVQAALSLPLFLLALPAGALADIIDRRRLLLMAQIWMALAAAALGVFTVLGITTAWTLLLFTFLLGVGAALNAPAWQAIVLDVVPRSDLSAAVSLNSAGFNVARAVGPSLGGVILAAFGAGINFILNAISFFAVVLVLFVWRKPPRHNVLPAERVAAAIRTGIRYVWHAPPVKVVMIRAASFILFGSSIPALLPVIARFKLERGPIDYGLMVGFFGAGSVAGAFILPHLRRRMNLDQLIIATSLAYAASTFGFALITNFGILCTAMFLAGMGWLTLLASFNASVQASVPLWVRGRALSVYLLIFFGGLTGGSAIWGAVAEATSATASLLYSAAGMLIALLATMQFSISSTTSLNLEPAMDWTNPSIVGEDIDTEHGAVMVTLEYLIDPARQADFISAMREVRRIRRRDGALRWGLGRDTTHPGRYVEMYVVESWMEHLRQHERLTIDDRAVFETARSFHISESPPAVSHFLFVEAKR